MTNVKTGKGQFAPFGGVAMCYPKDENSEPREPDVQFKPNSRLMMVSGTIMANERDADECLTRYYVKQNGRFKRAHAAPY